MKKEKRKKEKEKKKRGKFRKGVKSKYKIYFQYNYVFRDFLKILQ